MSDFDGPWKLAIERFLERFMQFFFPMAHAEVEWARGYEPLDKELPLLFPDGARGMLRIIDWMIDLPDPLQLQFWQDVRAIEQEKLMQYLMYPERVAMAKGHDEGRVEGRVEGQRELIELAARSKFGEAVAANLLTRLGQSPTPEMLKTTLLAVATAGSVEELDRLLTENG